MELLDEELSAPATSLYPHNLAGILETAIRYRIVFQNFSQSSQKAEQFAKVQFLNDKIDQNADFG